MHTTLDERYYLDAGKLPDGTYLLIDDNTLMPTQHTFGYYVAYTNPNLPKSAYSTSDPTQVNDLVNRVVTDEGYVGIWTDDEGVTWVEQSFWIEHEFPAVALGRAWGQYSIWDCYNGNQIIL